MQPQPAKLPCIQIISPCPSPSPSEYEGYPLFLSTSEFDPVLYREELLRRAYLSRFPIDRPVRPDCCIAVGNSEKACSTIVIEVKGRNASKNAVPPTKNPTAFWILSGAIAFVFIIMIIVYFTGFVHF